MLNIHTYKRRIIVYLEQVAFKDVLRKKLFLTPIEMVTDRMQVTINLFLCGCVGVVEKKSKQTVG